MMKKIILLLTLIVLTISCKDDEKNKKSKFVYQVQNTKKVEEAPAAPKEKIAVASTPVDLSDKGVGPIKSLELGEINQDLVEQGKTHFNKLCTACHTIEKRLVGPALKGVIKRASPEWIMNMILNPTEMLEKNPKAKKLLETYKAPMISQNLTQDQARAVLEYFRTL